MLSSYLASIFSTKWRGDGSVNDLNYLRAIILENSPDTTRARQESWSPEPSAHYRYLLGKLSLSWVKLWHIEKRVNYRRSSRLAATGQQWYLSKVLSIYWKYQIIAFRISEWYNGLLFITLVLHLALFALCRYLLEKAEKECTIRPNASALCKPFYFVSVSKPRLCSWFHL